MESNNREYTNGEITVYWKPSTCIHSAICYTRLREVFDPTKRPWVNMDGATTEKIIDIVKKCPTDALTFKYNSELKQTKYNESEAVNLKDRLRGNASNEGVKMQVMKDGPLVVEGNFTLIEANGTKVKMAKMASFCRCGHSKNMPFCDGTHRMVGFSG